MLYPPANEPATIANASPVEDYLGKCVVARAIEFGWAIGVAHSDVKHSRDYDEIIGAMGATGEDVLRFYRVDASGKVLERVGFVMLIWGNEADLWSDNTDNEEMNRLFSKYCEEADRF